MDDKWEFRPGSDFAEVIDKVRPGEAVEVTSGSIACLDRNPEDRRASSAHTS